MPRATKGARASSKGLPEGGPKLTPEEANEQNRQELQRQKGQGQRLKDFYCKDCRALTPEEDMTQDKDGYYLCKSH